MKRSKFLVFLTISLLGMILLSACGFLPLQSARIAPTVTQEVDIEGFDQVEVRDAFEIQIRQGDNFSVKVETDQVSSHDLEVVRSGDTLRIGLKPQIGFSFWNRNRVLRAEITMPTLLGVNASDASQVEISGFTTTEAASFHLSDASWLRGEINAGEAELVADDASHIVLDGEFGDVDIDVRGASHITWNGGGQNVIVHASDASHVTLSGEGQDVIIYASDTSHVNLSEFPVKDATVEAIDVNDVQVDLSGTLNARANDSSTILYEGDPTLGDIQIVDNSEVRRS